MNKRQPESFTVESPEFRGTELEKTYKNLLDGEIVGGHGDKGKDILIENVPGVAIIQVKNSWFYARDHLKKGLQFKNFIPIVVGDPGQHSKEEIFESIIENGGWIGDDVDDLGGSKEKALAGIKQVRDEIENVLGKVEKKDKHKVA
jgi:hypothetical protein